MEVQKVSIGQLNPAAYNPRKDLKPGDAEYEKLKRSIEEFGYVEPIVWNRHTGNIVGGHQRLKVLSDLGQTEIDCVVLDIDEQREKALNVALNKIQGEFDIPLLTDLLKDIGAGGFDVSLTGFDAAELDALFRDSMAAGIKEDDFDEPLPETPVSKQGDIWMLGRHRLICGDATKPETYARLMETVNFRTAFAEAGFFCHQTCIWVKNTPVLGRCDYQYSHEPILVGWKPTAGHNWYADRRQRTTWNFDRPAKSKYHPTMKPVALCAYPVMNSSLANDIVLDPFGGSGSTLIACEQTNRVCYTIELNEKYCDVIVKRYIGQKGSDADVYLLRDTQKMAYRAIKKAVE